MAAQQPGHQRPAAAIDNGVIVTSAAGTRWAITDTSYLTSLALDATSSVQAPSGKTLTLTVAQGE